jgi:teichuronic acid biosynthesis glycosyltransferase TuaC
VSSGPAVGTSSCGHRTLLTKEIFEMNVLVVTNMYPSKDEPWFGAFVEEQIDSIRSQGVDVEVFAFDGRSDWRAYLRAAKTVRRLTRIKSVDVVHAHYGLSGAVALAQRATPVVTTFHGSETGYVRWQTFISRLVAKASTPVFVSKHNADALGYSKAIVIPCGIDLSLFTPKDPTDARRTLKWNGDAKYVLFPGSRKNERKAPELYDAALAAARRRGVRIEPVSLEGYSRNQVVDVMNAVDATLMTSRWEGSPMAVKESLACCTPVISVPVGDVGEILPGLPGCHVVERSAEALGEALLQALSTGKSSELRLSVQRFSHDQVARRVIDVYERILQGKNDFAVPHRQAAGGASHNSGAHHTHRP